MTRVAARLSAAAVSAQRDAGDSRGDKTRKATLLSFAQTARSLLESVPAGSLPEVEEAAKSVQASADLSDRLDKAAKRLRKARAGSTEAVEAQRALDLLRSSADAMTPVLDATLQTLLMLTAETLKLEANFQALNDQVRVEEETLKREKARLTAAAQAVKNAVQIG